MLTTVLLQGQVLDEKTRKETCPSALATVYRGGLSVAFLTSLVLPHFGLWHLACRSLSLENFHCAATSVSAFTFSRSEEHETDTPGWVFVRGKPGSTPSTAVFGSECSVCATGCGVGIFVTSSCAGGGVACSWTCCYSA